MENIKDFICGLMAGWSQIVTGQPFDYIKTHFQLSQKSVTYKHIRQMCKQTILQNGLMGFYRGSSSLFFGYSFTIGIQFAVYEACKKYLMDTKYKQFTKTPQQILSMTQIMLSGSIVGFLASFIFCPIQYVKIIRQTNPNYPKGSFRILLDSILGRKVNIIYKGYIATFFRETLGTAVYFSAYQGSIRLLCRSRNKERNQADTKQFFLAGGTGGFLYWTLVYPFDVIKTQRQNGRQYRQILSKLHGNAFQGYGLMAVRSIVANCSSFTVFQYTKSCFKSISAKY